jgi:hypothetical protein
VGPPSGLIDEVLGGGWRLIRGCPSWAGGVEVNRRLSLDDHPDMTLVSGTWLSKRHSCVHDTACPDVTAACMTHQPARHMWQSCRHVAAVLTTAVHVSATVHACHIYMQARFPRTPVACTLLQLARDSYTYTTGNPRHNCASVMAVLLVRLHVGQSCRHPKAALQYKICTVH